jgi:hypothetical protein
MAAIVVMDRAWRDDRGALVRGVRRMWGIGVGPSVGAFSPSGGPLRGAGYSPCTRRIFCGVLSATLGLAPLGSQGLAMTLSTSSWPTA